MSNKMARKAIDFFIDRNHAAERCFISFYGGEPTLAMNTIRNSVDYIRYRSDREVLINMTTNAVTISEDDIRFFAKKEINLLVSIDGPRETHDRFRVTANGSPTFDKVYRNLSRMREIDEEYFKSRVGLSIVITPPYDIHKLRDFFENDQVLRDLRFSVNTVNNHTDTFFQTSEARDALAQTIGADDGFNAMLCEYKRNLVRGQPERSRFLSSLFMEGFLRLHKGGKFNGYGDYIYMNGSCIPGVRRVFVTASGDFLPCERVNDTLRIGNVRDGFDFEAAVEMIETYIKGTTQNCVECFANRYCGSCMATCFSMSGFHARNKEVSCDEIRWGLIGSLVNYFEVLEANPNAFDFMDDIEMS